MFLTLSFEPVYLVVCLFFCSCTTFLYCMLLFLLKKSFYNLLAFLLPFPLISSSFFFINLSSKLFIQSLTLDYESSLFLPRVLHRIKCLLSDAVQIHISPVLQHLKGDICTVDDCPRCLQVAKRKKNI